MDNKLKAFFKIWEYNPHWFIINKIQLKEITKSHLLVFSVVDQKYLKGFYIPFVTNNFIKPMQQL